MAPKLNSSSLVLIIFKFHHDIDVSPPSKYSLKSLLKFLNKLIKHAVTSNTHNVIKHYDLMAKFDEITSRLNNC